MGKKFFLFSSITWHEIDFKVAIPNLTLMENALNESIDLSNYGTGVQEIAYVFVALRPTNTLHGETLRYYKAKQEVFIQKKLPYELVKAYNSAQILFLMAVTYLQSLEQLSKRKIVDFDGPRLAADVKNLFEQNGWLAEVEEVLVSA